MAGTFDWDGDTHPKVAADVVSRRVDDELVLVRLDTNEIFAINGTGARIWELLSEDVPARDILGTLEQEFDARPEDLEREVAAFIGRLSDEGFLTR